MKYFLILILMLISKIGMSQIMLPAYQGVVSKIPAVVTPAFTCSTSTITDVDSNVYNTVLIGTQCWTRENLRVRRYNNGTSILFNKSGGSVGTTTTWENLTIGAHTIYAHDSTTTPSNLTKYGYLYNWYAAKGITTAGSTTYSNICPVGWHVPIESEWKALTDYLGGVTNAGGKMKSTGITYWLSPNSGTNESGFSALPGGDRNLTGGFAGITFNAVFCSATVSSVSSNGVYYNLNYIHNNVSKDGGSSKGQGGSIRCLRD